MMRPHPGRGAGLLRWLAMPALAAVVVTAPAKAEIGARTPEQGQTSAASPDGQAGAGPEQPAASPGERIPEGGKDDGRGKEDAAGEGASRVPS